MNNKGYSFIEVVIAGAILSIFILPVVSTIYQSMRNLMFSDVRYNATILADSLLIEATNSILIMDNPQKNLQAMHSNNSLITDVLNITQDDFDNRYKTDLFNYILRIDNYSFSTGEINLGYLFTCGNIEFDRTPNLNPQAEHTSDIHDDEIIVYESYYLRLLQTGGHVNIAGDTITVNIPSYVSEHTDILIDLSSMLSNYMQIYIANLSASNVNLQIYVHADLPRENIRTTYNSTRSSGSILTTISTRKEVLSLILTVEVFDKDNNILNTVFRPILV